MPYTVTPTAISDILVLQPKVFGDTRGFFFESFNERAFKEQTGVSINFVQDNHSCSAKGVLRGLHYQLPPHAQGKLVRVVRGAVFDVAVDIRKGSPTFGQWVGALLTEDNHRQLWIPPGLAHGRPAGGERGRRGRGRAGCRRRRRRSRRSSRRCPPRGHRRSPRRSGQACRQGHKDRWHKAGQQGCHPCGQAKGKERQSHYGPARGQGQGG